MNLLEQQSLKFDFLEHFKKLGNTIMNLFKSKPAGKSSEASGEEQEIEDETSITIED